MKIIKSKGPEIFDIELEKDILAKNRNLAKENKKRFDRSNILAIDIMGSIGSGKTSLIKANLKRLEMGKKVAVIAGDLTTTIDAERIETEEPMYFRSIQGRNVILMPTLFVRR